MKLAIFKTTVCGACQMMQPIFDELKKDHEITIINLDDHPDHPYKKSIRAVPTIAAEVGNTFKTLAVGYTPLEIINHNIKLHNDYINNTTTI